MNLTTLIFSKDRRVVLTRHSLFWIGWIFYYCIPAYLSRADKMPATSNAQLAVFELTAGTVIDMAYCYIIIYWLIPRFFYRGAFGSFFLLWVLHTVLFVFLFRWYNQTVLLHIRDLFDVPRRPAPPFYQAFFWLFPSLGFEGCLAAVIVLGKNWYVSNQNFLRLRAEKRTANRYEHIQNGTVVLFPVLETIFQPIGKEHSMAAVAANGGVLAEKTEPVLNFIKQITAQAQRGHTSLDEELANLRAYMSLQEESGVNFIEAGGGGELSASVLPNFLLAVLSLPLLDREQLLAGAPIRVQWHTQNSELHFLLEWQRSTGAGGLKPSQYEGLQRLKTILNFHYPRSNEFEANIRDQTVRVSLSIRLRERV